MYSYFIMSAQYVLISFNVQRRSPLQELAILALECLASKSTICSIWAMKSLESENIKLEIKVDPSFTDLPASQYIKKRELDISRPKISGGSSEIMFLPSSNLLAASVLLLLHHHLLLPNLQFHKNQTPITVKSL